MLTSQFPCPGLLLSSWDFLGTANSNNAAEPHSSTTQSGASRSVAPERERRDFRFFEERKRASLNWYLSMKRYEGRVRCAWSLQEGAGGERCAVGKRSVRVGWRPVGLLREVV